MKNENNENKSNEKNYKKEETTKKSNKVRNTLIVLALLIPCFLALIGFALYNKTEGASYSIWDELYFILQMYSINYGEGHINAFIEIARWLAPIMSLALLTAVLLNIRRLCKRLYAFFAYLFHRNTLVVVYGDERLKKYIFKQKGRFIDGNSFGEKEEVCLYRAKRYILLWDEEKNFSFYNDNIDVFKKWNAKVYIRCTKLRPQEILTTDLIPFSIEENAAREFWKSKHLYKAAKEKDFKLKISILGFGELGEKVLDYGIINNIFSPDEKIVYNIYGDESGYLSRHYHLDEFKNNEEIVFNPVRKEIKGSTLIIIVDKEKSLEYLSEALLYLGKETDISFDVFTENVSLSESFKENLEIDNLKLNIFPLYDEGLKLENIFKDDMVKSAIVLNRAFTNKNGNQDNKKKKKRIDQKEVEGEKGKEEKSEEEEWEDRKAFSKYSSFASVDYVSIREDMLKDFGIDYKKLKEENYKDKLELLSELEHIRWCVFHYLNNWKFGEVNLKGKDGKELTKDISKRIHKDLVEYGTLSEGEKQKDRDILYKTLELEDAIKKEKALKGK